MYESSGWATMGSVLVREGYKIYPAGFPISENVFWFIMGKVSVWGSI